MSTQWQVTTTHLLTSPPDDDTLSAITAGLPGYGMTGLIGERLTLHMTVGAPALADAVAEALRVARGLVEAPALAASAQDYEDFISTLESPPPLDLVTVTEIAEMAGKTQQWASLLVDKEEFPPPATVVGAKRLRLWHRHTVERFLTNYRPRTGRPPRS